MAQFAKIDESNAVVEIVDINDSILKEPISGEDNEILGLAHCIKLYGGVWKQTSDDIRVRRAKIGYTYSAELDAFIPPKPYSSWILNNQIANWEAPDPKPSEIEIKDQENNGFILIWNEDLLSWEFLDTKVFVNGELITEFNDDFLENADKINYYTSIQK